MKKSYLGLTWATILILLAYGGVSAQNFIGPNLVPNAGFEESAEEGLPAQWQLSDHPQDCAEFGLDQEVFLVEETALKAELPEAGGLNVYSQLFPVQGGQEYLFSVAYRLKGFGPPGVYSGVSSSVNVQWLDAEGKGVGRSPGVGFPYNAIDWDLGDRFIPAPAAATQAAIQMGFSNDSTKQTGKNIPSTVWLDAVQLRLYTPLPTPEWAKQEVTHIVEGGWETSRVKWYHLATLGHAGGKWGPIVPDPDSTYGTVASAPEGVGRGIMSHSPYFGRVQPGLYRAVLRCKVADLSRTEKVGFMDLFSQFASARAQLDLYPRDFQAADTYQEFSVDFVLRTPGYWGFRVYTEGNQPFTADAVKIFPLVLFQDQQLLDLYPGSEGTIPKDLKPPRWGTFSVLLVAGPLHKSYRLADAIHLCGYQVKVEPVWVHKHRTQTFEGFPETAGELFQHHLVYLCDVNVASMTLRQKHMLSEYVRRGGGLIVLGGHKAFGRGGIPGSLLEEVLPVECPAEALPPLLHFPEGATLAPGVSHPLTEYLDFGDSPLCFFLHNLQPRPEATALLTAAGQPAVVLGQFGQGRVACIGLTCFGDPAENQTPFWQEPGWVIFLRDLSWWVGTQDQHFPGP